MRVDPYQLHNLYSTASQAIKDELAIKLAQAYTCRGADCP